MSLLDFQTALGQAVRVPGESGPARELNLTADERARAEAIVGSPGFRFTVEVQRSWNRGRATGGARLTLSLLPLEERNRILDEWVRTGGGMAAFVSEESDAFLEFIAGHLVNPSHELTLCRLEQAALRASGRVPEFTPPDPSRLEASDCVLQTGRGAALVYFHAEPHLLLASLDGQPLPPLSPCAMPVLFGPGLDGLFRAATADEVALWKALSNPVAVSALKSAGYRREMLADSLITGVVEIVNC